MPHCPECAATVTVAATYCSTCGAALRSSATTTSSQPKASRPSEDVLLQEELRATLAPRYELLKPLGDGGMGAVFLAREPALKRLVAVKVLSPYLMADDTACVRFEREARAAAALSHPNVVSVYAVGVTGALALPYIVMQYVEGPPLSHWIRDHGKTGEREARRILGGIAAALAAAHARGLVHRDVKPGNILLDPGSNRVLVADFGLAAALSAEGQGAEDAALTASGMVLGTPMYMSPEQGIGEPISAKSDVYSLGVVAYELLTGTLPFTAKSAMGWSATHLRDQPPAIGDQRPDLSPEVAQLVDRCLAKSPADRPTALEFAEGVLPTLETEVQWPPPGLAPLLGRGRTLARSALVAGLGLLILVMVLAIPPRRLRAEGAWWTDFAAAPVVTGSSLGVRGEAVPSSPPGAPGWWFAAMTLGLATTAMGLVWLVALSFPTLRSVLRHRGAGWGRATLADVLADPDGRSGLLLSGSREIAAIPSERRARILQARRRISGTQLLAGLWVLLVGGGLALLAVLGILPPLRPSRLGWAGLWVLFLVPLIVCLGSAVASVIEESRLFGALPRRRAHTGTFAALRSMEPTPDAAAWYATLPAGHLSGAPRPLKFAGWLHATYLIAALLGFAALLALALISAASVVAARRAWQLGPETAEGAALLAQDTAGGFWGQAPDAWSAYVPPPRNLSDSGGRILVRRLRSARSSAGLAAYPIDPSTIIGTLGRDTLGHGVAAAFRSGPPKIVADTVRTMEVLSEHPRTALLREIAMARRVDLFGAMLDRPLAAYGTLDSLPQPQYEVFRAAAQANVLGALLALWRGDREAAGRRLGENLAVAEHFLRAPSVFANRYGVGLLQQLALLPLAEVERSRGNRDQAQRLIGAGDQMREEVLSHAWPGSLAGLAADPQDLSLFSAALRNDRLSPGYRIESFYGGWAGFCLNRWEILGGVSRYRDTTVMKTAEAMGDLPHAVDLARLTAAMWDRESRTSLSSLIGRLRWCWKRGP